MGASAIITGLSSEIAQTLVDLGVDLGMMRTVGDLQGGLEEAERLLGYDGRRLASRCRTRRCRAPMAVAILRQGDCLIASIQSALSPTSEVVELRDDLAERVGRFRARGHRRRRRGDSTSSTPSSPGRCAAIALTARLRGARDRHRRDPAGRRDRDGRSSELNLEPLHAGARPRRGARAATTRRRAEERTAMVDEIRVRDRERRRPRSWRARRAARWRSELGFSRTDATLIATAISEVARNIVVHVGAGEIVIRPVRRGAGRTRLVSRRARRRARDSATPRPHSRTASPHGAASASACPARGGSWTSSTIDSADGRGTTVSMTKWRVLRRARAAARGRAGVAERDARLRRSRYARSPGERVVGRPRGRRGRPGERCSSPRSTGWATGPRPPRGRTGRERRPARSSPRESPSGARRPLPRRASGHPRRGAQPGAASRPRGGTLTWVGVGNVEGRLLRARRLAAATAGVARACERAWRATRCRRRRPCRFGSGAGTRVVFATDGVERASPTSSTSPGPAQEVADRILDGARPRARTTRSSSSPACVEVGP